MSDSIDRDDALMCLTGDITGMTIEDYIKMVEERVKALPSSQPDIDKQKLVRTITAGIVATSTKDVYSCGMRNGMRWCRALLEEGDPKFEDASLYAQPEIIRCRDCISYREGIDINGRPFTRCNGSDDSVRTYGPTLPDWYCGDAKRRTDG